MGWRAAIAGCGVAVRLAMHGLSPLVESVWDSLRGLIQYGGDLVGDPLGVFAMG